jgi:hypothetical protein
MPGAWPPQRDGCPSEPRQISLLHVSVRLCHSNSSHPMLPDGRFHTLPLSAIGYADSFGGRNFAIP